MPICIDTEGAQIRTKIKGRAKFFAKGKKLKISTNRGSFQLYPDNVFEQIKTNDVLDIGFEGLKIKVIKNNSKEILCKCLTSGKLENNKGVHIVNRKIKLDFITEKDMEAIKISKKFNIQNFALSFTNSSEDIKKFEKILPNKKKIFKIETNNALKNLKSLLKTGENFLIDRGDLSKEIGIKYVPIAQRKILIERNKFKKKINISIATNFLESMILKPFPTRAEVNDIYNSLELGANNLVLAAETAIGKYPEKCIRLLRDIIKVYKSN